VALIQEGRILSVDTPKEIIQQYPKRILAAKADDMYTLLMKLKQQPYVEMAYPFGDYHHVVVQPEDRNAVEQIRALGATEVMPCEPSIEDSFIMAMQHKTNSAS
jgi:hypothetical protein